MAYPEPLPTVGGDDDAWGPILNDAIGSIDGRLNTAETKLSGVEAGATADQTGAEIKVAYEAEADTNAYTDAEKSKLAGVASGAEVNTVDSVNGATGTVVLDPDDLDDTSTTHKFATAAQLSKIDGVEAGADVTDTANVTAAGALMDSEVTNLADVKAFAPGDYATAAQGALADSATQPGDLATVATTGDYTDLANRPTLGTAASKSVGTASTDVAAGDAAHYAVEDITWNGTNWNYRGGTTSSRPSKPAGTLRWRTEGYPTFNEPPSLAITPDTWRYDSSAVLQDAT